jgi:hypothetical protein
VTYAAAYEDLTDVSEAIAHEEDRCSWCRVYPRRKVGCKGELNACTLYREQEGLLASIVLTAVRGEGEKGWVIHADNSEAIMGKCSTRRVPEQLAQVVLGQASNVA